MHRLLILISLCWLLWGATAVAVEAEPPQRWQRFFTDDRLAQVEQQFGATGRQRVAALQSWLQRELQQVRPTQERLQVVNRYFNQFRFVADQQHWQQADYWATPIEMVASGGGDCEDFTIAKYFTLRVLQVQPERLRLMYVKALELNQAHMVLLYLEQPDAMPLVLDNLTDRIVSGDQRPDLQPVYSFNAEGLWRARAFDQGIQLKAGDNGVELWGELLLRLQQEEQG